MPINEMYSALKQNKDVWHSYSGTDRRLRIQTNEPLRIACPQLVGLCILIL